MKSPLRRQTEVGLMFGREHRILVKIAESSAELFAAQRLRYDVFVKELGSDGPHVDHANQLERDQFDDYADQLIAIDQQSGNVVGTYRLLRQCNAERLGQFYSENEYDISLLKQSDHRLLELGRSCLHRDYRGGLVMRELWAGIAEFVMQHKATLLFGVASFWGSNINYFAHSLSYLYHNYLASHELRPKARSPMAASMNLIPKESLDTKKALVQMPSLIKAYVRLGGTVGDGVYLDTAFNTIDICLILDTTQLKLEKKYLYSKVSQ